MGRQVLILSSFLVLVFGACAQNEPVAPPVDLAAEKEAVESVISQFVGSMENLDIEQFSKVVAHDSDMMSFGTDAGETWVGWEALLESIRKQFTTYESAQVSVKEQVVHVHDTGGTAWFANVSDWRIQSGGETVDLPGMRMTGVLEKRSGNWLIVQFHVSVPATGQAVEY